VSKGIKDIEFEALMPSELIGIFSAALGRQNEIAIHSSKMRIYATISNGYGNQALKARSHHTPIRSFVFSY